MAATAPQTTGSPLTGSPPTRGPIPLTPGRIAVLVVGVPLCLGLIAYNGFNLVANFAEGRYSVSYTAPASTKSLTVSSDGGQLSIKPAATGGATLTGTAHYTFVRSKLTERTAAAGGTALGYHCAESWVGNCALDATISLPATMPVTASTAGGDATVTGISAPVRLSSGGGNLSADHTSGLLSLDTSGGDISVTTVTAPTVTASSGGGNITVSGVSSPEITANTSGGDIQATAVTSSRVTASSGGGNITVSGVSSPEITANTSGGDIQATAVTSNTVTATSGGGNIEIDFAAVPGNVEVNTSGGDITLVLPPGGTQYRITAHTDGGSVSDSSVPENTSSKHVITVTTGGGNITIVSQQ